MRIVVVSDTHDQLDRVHVPEGDVLVHCGDALGAGTLAELETLDRLFGRLPHPHKILIAGNHDWCFERHPADARRAVTNATYLEDEAVTVDRVLFYGSPWQPEFGSWAFNLPRGQPLADVWSRIPATTQVLVTHGPPYGILDRVRTGARVGVRHSASGFGRFGRNSTYLGIFTRVTGSRSRTAPAS